MPAFALGSLSFTRLFQRRVRRLLERLDATHTDVLPTGKYELIEWGTHKGGEHFVATHSWISEYLSNLRSIVIDECFVVRWRPDVFVLACGCLELPWKFRPDRCLNYDNQMRCGHHSPSK